MQTAAGFGHWKIGQCWMIPVVHLGSTSGVDNWIMLIPARIITGPVGDCQQQGWVSIRREVLHLSSHTRLMQVLPGHPQLADP